MADQFSLQLDSINEATDKYINDLINEAGGDRDFIVRKLDAEHELALGTDNAARAQFLEKVADGLEKRIGRIPYDYEKFTTRELEDYARGTTRLQQDTSTALTRLNEDEKVLKEKLAVEQKGANRTQQEELASRGLLNGTRDEVRGVASTLVGEQNQEFATQGSAIDRAVARDKETALLEQTRGMEDFGQTRDRNMVDIKTTARRGALDQINTYTFGKEAANRAYEKQKKALERQREIDKLNNSSFAMALSA